jgi:hypothetical protein
MGVADGVGDGKGVAVLAGSGVDIAATVVAAAGWPLEGPASSEQAAKIKAIATHRTAGRTRFAHLLTGEIVWHIGRKGQNAAVSEEEVSLEIASALAELDD